MCSFGTQMVDRRAFGLVSSPRKYVSGDGSAIILYIDISALVSTLLLPMATPEISPTSPVLITECLTSLGYFLTS